MKTGIGSFSLAAKSNIPSRIFLEFPTPDSHLPWKNAPYCSMSKKCRSISSVLGLVKDVKNEGGSNIRKRAIVGIPNDHCQSPLELDCLDCWCQSLRVDLSRFLVSP